MIRVLWVLLIAWNCTGFYGAAQGQPPQALSRELLAEGATALARAARERGDSVRGAILYSQQKFNCVGCHAPGAMDLLGPDLTQIGRDVKDEYFVESILLPSKEIKKGFESVKVLTQDGRIVTGRVVREDDDEVVLRDTSEASRLIKIAKNSIDEMKRNTKSAMPDTLADQLADRQQFLDLVKYIMDIADTGQPVGASHPVHAAGGRNVDERIRGMVLLDHFSCTNCHSDGTMDGMPKNVFPKKRSPDLKSSTARIDPRYIQRFIADPLHVKPGTSMPDVMADVAADTKKTASVAITHYLLSLNDESFKRQATDSVSASRGHELFHSVGCIACHSPRDDDGSERMAESSVPLGNLIAKYNIDGLASFLEDPHSVRPSGRMPNMVLSHWEAIDIANYLLKESKVRGGANHAYAPMQLVQSQVSLGKRYFHELGCVHCHELDGTKPRPDYPSLADSRTDQGCLSSRSGAWPHYELDQSQRDAIRTAIGQRSEPLTDQQQIVLTMETFRCFACHGRDELDGVSDQRDEFFRTSNENLGPQGRIPPTLTGVGGKLKSKWLREVLVSGRAIRPYMKTRMPQYGADNVAHLVDLFQQVDELPVIEFGEIVDPKEIKKVGVDLAGRGGLNCIACHTFQQKLSQTMPAVDLTEMAQRLHKQWFYQYMRSPQSLSPGTVMPSFWPGGKAMRTEILDGDPNQQIEAIWQYLLDGRQARTPRGLHVEPIELLATDDQAVMLRRSYQGIGKRGIGVGYPGGVNLAFDAEQMRIAMIWKGKFADPGGVWRGQGHGHVRPLGTDLVRFGLGPELDDAKSPWVVDDGRPPKHQFTGYVLDNIGRPTFTYRFDTIDVEDYSIDVKDEESGETILKRTLTFTSKHPRKDLVFRAGTGDKIALADDRTFLLGGSLRIRVDDDHEGKIIDATTGKQLVIPLEIPGGKTELVLQYDW